MDEKVMSYTVGKVHVLSCNQVIHCPNNRLYENPIRWRRQNKGKMSFWFKATQQDSLQWSYTLTRIHSLISDCLRIKGKIKQLWRIKTSVDENLMENGGNHRGFKEIIMQEIC